MIRRIMRNTHTAFVIAGLVTSAMACNLLGGDVSPTIAPPGTQIDSPTSRPTNRPAPPTEEISQSITPLVDAVSWHLMHGTSPQFDDYRDYYYGYPDLVQEIKDVATAHGFDGEYQADEIG